jgi:single-strand DNA-binding protein
MINNVVLMGRLTASPELRTTGNGKQVCSFTLAIDAPTTENKTDFISCTAFGKNADWMSKYNEKGSMVIVEGVLKSGSYTDRKHEDVTHYTTEVWANRVSFGETKAEKEARWANAVSRQVWQYP